MKTFNILSLLVSLKLSQAAELSALRGSDHTRMLSDSSCCAPEVTGYTIVDKNGMKLYDLALGQNNMISGTPLQKVNIIANVKSCPDLPVESVLVAFDGSNALRGPEGKCENYAPYTIFGDPSSQDLAVTDANYKRYAVDIAAGSHKVTARPKIGNDCCGCSTSLFPAYFTIGTTRELEEVNEIVLEDEGHRMLTNPATCFAPTVTGFTIVDKKGMDLVTVTPGDNGILSIPGPINRVNIRVEYSEGSDLPVDSVAVLFDGTSDLRGPRGNCENNAPYTVFGDPSTVDISDSEADYKKYANTISVGTHTVEAILYPGANCCGCGGEVSFKATFEVVASP